MCNKRLILTKTRTNCYVLILIYVLVTLYYEFALSHMSEQVHSAVSTKKVNNETQEHMYSHGITFSMYTN